eukprot:907865_1
MALLLLWLSGRKKFPAYQPPDPQKCNRRKLFLVSPLTSNIATIIEGMDRATSSSSAQISFTNSVPSSTTQSVSKCIQKRRQSKSKTSRKRSGVKRKNTFPPTNAPGQWCVVYPAIWHRAKWPGYNSRTHGLTRAKILSEPEILTRPSQLLHCIRCISDVSGGDRKS